jgi:hypothetical protein
MNVHLKEINVNANLENGHAVINTITEMNLPAVDAIVNCI